MNKYDYQFSLDSPNNSAAAILQLVGHGRKVLEIGPASGAMTRIMKEELGCKVTCVEIDPDLAEAARPFAEKMIVADIETLDFNHEFGHGELDVVVLADVLEHLKDPRQVLLSIRPCLADDGYLVLSVPNIAHASIVLELMQGNFDYRDTGLLDKSHLHFFTRKSLQFMLESAGYVVSRCERILVSPEHTEFKNTVAGLPTALINVIDGNDEAKTYQFILKAYKAMEAGLILSLREQVAQFQRQGEELEAIKRKVDRQALELKEKDRTIHDLMRKSGHDEVVIEGQKNAIAAQLKRHREMEEKRDAAEAELRLILNSKAWRLAELMRNIRYVKLPGSAHLLKKGVSAFARGGVSEFWRKLALYCRHNKKKLSGGLYKSEYDRWLERNRLSIDETAIAAEISNFQHQPLISLIMPVYKVSPQWLRLAIDSVIHQWYQNWELCIVDDGSRDAVIQQILEEYGHEDRRIKVKFLTENSGIANASNEALALAHGEYIGFVDHDDELSSDALFGVLKAINENPDVDLIYSDEDIIDEKGNRSRPFFKPGWSPDLLLSVNYICHFLVCKKDLVEKIGGFDVETDGAQDHDLLLRLIPYCRYVVHLDKILYHWRSHAGSTASDISRKQYAMDNGAKAVERFWLTNYGIKGSAVYDDKGYAFKPDVLPSTRISIIIPFKDRVDLLRNCMEGLLQRTQYPEFECLLVSNNSREATTFAYLDTLREKDPRVKVLEYNQPFNYSAINNFAVKQARGELFLFLNNDIEVIHPDWLEQMAIPLLRPEVGIVGAQLLYPNGLIQHSGVIIGMGGFAGHVFSHLKPTSSTYYGAPCWQRNFLAVTGACLLIRKKVFDEIGGFDERFVVCGSDVSLCLAAYQAGYRVVCEPRAQLVHHESASRKEMEIPEMDYGLSLQTYGQFLISGDPYFNRNLSLADEKISLNFPDTRPAP